MSEFSLEKNAFSVLQVSIRATRENIVEAHDDRLFDEGEEAALGEARAKLTVARDRLAEEISFLADTTPSRAKEIVSASRTLRSPDHAAPLWPQLENLSLINFLTDLVRRFPGDENLIRRTFEAQLSFDPDAARASIEDARSVSGFGQVRDEQWRRELSTLQDRHGAIFTAGLTASPTGPEELANLLESVLSSPLSAWARGFVDKAVSYYDAWSEPKLARIEERLDEVISTARADPKSTTFLSQVEDCICEWDKLSQPVQLRDQSHGLDEPKSKRVFGKVRDLAVWLANDQHQHRAAKSLSETLQRHFPELPSVLVQVEEDIATLEELIEASRGQEILAPLAGATEYAKDHLTGLANDVLRGHFSSGGDGLAGELFQKFEEARRRASELPKPELPWWMLRSIAVDLNNEAHSPRAAETVLLHIGRSATGVVKERIDDDLAVVRTLVLSEQLTDCIREGELSQAQDLLTNLIDTDPGEREKYQLLKAKLAREQASRTLKRVGWAAAAVIAFFVIVLDGSEIRTDASSSGESYGATESRYAPEPTESREADAEVNSEELQGEETAPPLGFWGTLSTAQLRYCVFEEERLRVLEREVPPSGYFAFNQRVSDFNSRCSNTRYYDSDRRTVDSELPSARNRLADEARALIAEWTASSPATPELPNLIADEQSPVDNSSEVNTNTSTEDAHLTQDWLNSVLNSESQ